MFTASSGSVEGGAKPVGLALLGLGRAGSFHLESARVLPEVAVRRVFDPDGERARLVSAESGARRAGSAEEAIADPEVDAVIVATPTQTHHALVLAALEAGRAVLSEKPLGTTEAEIDACFARAEAQGQPLLVAFQRRFDPAFGAVAEAAHAGRAGVLQHVRSVSRDNPLPSFDYIRDSCGIFHDCIVHDLDLVCWIAREWPDRVFAFGSSFVPEIAAMDDLDNVAVALRFPSGLLASIDVNRRSVYGYDQRVEVFGSQGMLQSENRPIAPWSAATAEGVSTPPYETSFPTRYREAYRQELACFAACVRGEREAPVSAESVRRVHRLADAAEASWRRGEPVRPDDLA